MKSPKSTKAPRAPKWQKLDSNLEARFQSAIVAGVRLLVPDCLVFHVPNGGPGRSLSKLVWIGMVPGMTDLVIVDKHGLAHFAEIKPPGGVLTGKQPEFRDYCRAMKFPWAQWTTMNDAERDLIRWGFTLRGRVTA